MARFQENDLPKVKLKARMQKIIGGFHSRIGYYVTKSIPTLQETLRFVRITSSGIGESHPNNVTITKELPNYSR